MVQMIPDIISKEIKSTAEKNLFAQFRNTELREKVVILHSLGVAEHVNNIFGEIDFVIISKEGFLCVEVKGGAVERSAGQWSFTNRYGKRDTKTEGPFAQAQGNMQSLREYIVKRFGEKHPYSKAQYATCVLMPDCVFDYDGFDIIRSVLFDRSTGCDLSKVMKQSFSYWRNDLIRQYGFEGGYLSDDEIEQVANLLRGDFRFVPSLKDVVRDTYQELLALTDQQYDILESLDENPRLLISGLAGTGKSVLAIEQCKRALRCGKTVLYLCYNKNMAQYAKSQFEKEYLEGEATILPSLMERVCGCRNDDHSNTYFKVILPQRFLNTPERIRQYDLVVIDEGQDLINSLYLKCIDRIIKGGLKEGHWSIFFDPNQNIFNNETEMASELPKLKKLASSYALSVNCRNTKEIANANTLLTNIPQVNRLKASGPKVDQFPYTSLEDERNQIIDLINRLHDEGITNGDIVILSAYKMDNPKCFLSRETFPKTLCTIKADGKMWKARQDELRFSTISAFKGLEARVVILADVDNLTEASRKLLNYVAISRAETLLYVFYSNAVEDDRQSLMVKGYAKLNQG